MLINNNVTNGHYILTLLNKNYPLTTNNCNKIEIQRKMFDIKDEDDIYINIRNTLINQGVVFFGGFAISLYSQYMPKNLRKKLEKIPDFDVISHEPKTSAEIIVERLKDIGVKKIKIIAHEPIGEIIPYHVELRVGSETIAYIYRPIACHSYNKITIDDYEINVATIDTILAFYLRFLYIDNKYYNKDRILFIAKYLFNVEDKNRLAQIGLLKRFSLSCYGKQMSLEEMRAEKAEKYKELSGKRGTSEYDMWFLKYMPSKLDKSKHEKVDSEKGKDSAEPEPEDKIKNKKPKSKTVKKVTFIDILRKNRKTRKEKKTTGFFF